ncbi:hypothetical protein HGRIS_004643 [Hohenbuehelia grisea]|uniref:Uncharacterized protein n=1 Tax=Hohenbuehelia grisea TaxID=104357 RepID=A0ABR3JCH0_9AGAR
MRYSIFFTTAVAGTALAAPHMTWHDKRAKTFVCDKNLKIQLRVDPNNGRDVSKQTCLDVNNQNAPYYQYATGAAAATATTTSTAPETAKCEHIVEMQFLVDVLQSKGGACEQLKALTDIGERQAFRQRFREVGDIINNRPNLVFVDDELETAKGLLVNKMKAGLTFNSRADANTLAAVDDFLNNLTSDRSERVAKDLDTKIAKLFPGTTEKVITRVDYMKQFARDPFGTCQAGPSNSMSKRAPKNSKACQRPSKPPAAAPRKGKPSKNSPNKPQPGGRKAKPAVRKPTPAVRKPKPAARKSKSPADRKPKPIARKPKAPAPKAGPVKPAKKGSKRDELMELVNLLGRGYELEDIAVERRDAVWDGDEDMKRSLAWQEAEMEERDIAGNLEGNVKRGADEDLEILERGLYEDLESLD